MQLQQLVSWTRIEHDSKTLSVKSVNQLSDVSDGGKVFSVC